MEKFVDKSWLPILNPLLEQPSTQALFAYVAEERINGQVFPAEEYLFNAMKLTAFSTIKIVILGQDPYHNNGQAHGLSFSVPDGVPFPPSLRNIFSELSTDIKGFEIPQTGDLSSWSKQGVFLLNSILTVRAHEAGSHQNKGWEQFTDQIIKRISADLEHVVFILWGAYAQKKKVLIDAGRHCILTAVHPSPLSVYRGFYGSKPFSKANDYLIDHGKTPVNWCLT